LTQLGKLELRERWRLGLTQILFNLSRRALKSWLWHTRRNPRAPPSSLFVPSQTWREAILFWIEKQRKIVSSTHVLE